MSNSDRLTSQPGEKLPDLSMAQMVRKNAETYALTQTADIVMNKGFSAIFEALHSNYGAVAVKLVRTRRVPHYLWIPILVRDWMNEKGILSQLDHPSIVKLKGSDAQLYLYSLYLDFIPFRDLSRWRNRDNGHYFAGERGDARRVLDDMMAALAHIKSRSIIHNDIKPSNILYDPIKGAILIDFGLAASSSNRKLCTGGTPWYVAPEYLSQRRGPESDEYALGVVMLYLLKATPLSDTTEQQWDISSVSQNPDAFSHMRTRTEKIARKREGLGSTSIEETTKHLLQPDPAKRLSVVSVITSGQTH